MESGLRGAQIWLRKFISSNFWVKFHAWAAQQGDKYHEEIAAVNASLGLVKVRFLKHLSYKGAVRLPEWCPDDWEHWKCPATGQRYADLSNKLYLEFLLSVWPTALEELGISNPETGGDLLEALLGWYFVLTKENNLSLCNEADDFIAMLEQGLLYMFALKVVD